MRSKDSKPMQTILVLGLRAWIMFQYSTTISAKDSIQKHTERKLISTIDLGGFISIDCGAANNHTDEYSGIYYQTDEGFSDSGVNSKISSELISTDLNMELTTLRYFPVGDRNCYTMRLLNENNSRYLIRAIFMYGNYDGANSVPKFDLYLGPYRWTTVTNGSLTEKEIIYTLESNTLDVCLVNTNSGTPFISALEVRPITDPSFRPLGRGSFILDYRYSLGGSNDTVRYKDDVYGRKWYHIEDEGWIAMTPNLAAGTDTRNGINKAPAKVLGTAVKSSNGPINFSWESWNENTSYVMFFYFEEIEKLRHGEKRSILISLDNGIQNLSTVLEYLKPVMLTNAESQSLKGKKIHSFSISTTNNTKDLPPILSAFEIYHYKGFERSITDPSDAEAMKEIKKVYKITENWQGDPCFPIKYTWNGLRCDSQKMIIISLNLSSRGLVGNLTVSFSNLKAIQSLDLSHNNLSGPIPEFFAQLPFLKVLNLTGNMLEDSVPEALMEKSVKGELNLILDDNSKLRLTNPKPCLNKKAVVATVSVLTVVLLCSLTIFWIWRNKRKLEIQNNFNKEFSWKPNSRQFKFSELVTITNNFSFLIGEGGFGKVYHGILKDGTQVAVKLLSSSSRQGSKEFETEVKVLMGVHHRNLVSLAGFCKKGDKMALIYEYMVNGNLQTRLSSETCGILTWKERLQIAIDVARGLDYLHNGCKPPIVHRDLKTSNILLNENSQAKIADFGLSKLLTIESVSHIGMTTDPKGTFGYLDPVYYNTRKLNRKSDVYSFGVVLLELITGCRPVITRDGSEPAIHIGQWFKPNFETRDIGSIVDPKIEVPYNISSTWKAIDIAMACISYTAISRPDICHVYHQLKECLDTETANEKKQTTEIEDTESSINSLTYVE